PDITTTGTGRTPNTPTEHTLTHIYRDVLHLDNDTTLTVDDNFFHLGGHSLTATRLIARTNAQFGTALSLRTAFDSPTVAALATAVDSTAGSSPVSSSERIRIADVELPEVIPASYEQQSLWVIDQLGGPKSQYVVPTVLRLTGSLDTTAFTAAVHDVVERHATLRTLLVEHDGEPTQAIVPMDEVPARACVQVSDLRGTDRTQVDDAIASVVRTGFDLAVDLPIRVTVLRVDDTRWAVVIAVHHHAIDDWSTSAMLSALSSAYSARVDNVAPQWSPLSASYAQYAVWQRTVLGDGTDPASELAAHLDYWRSTLADAPDESIITPDRPRRTHPTHEGRDVSFVLDDDVVTGIRSVAEAHGVSMFALVHAATAITASLLGAGTDVVIGSPVGGRTEDGLEDLVGYFVNTLPLRHRMSPTDALSDVMAASHRTVLDGFAHQSAPFEHITRSLNISRVANRTPVFQILLTHIPVSSVNSDVLSLTGITAISTDVDVAELGAAKTDLELDFVDGPEGISGYLTYSTDLFSHNTIDRFVEMLVRVLGTTATRPDTRVSAIDARPALDEELLDLWSTGSDATGLEIPTTGATLDSLIRNQIQATPDAIALVDDTGTALTYAQFDTRIDAMTAVLLDTGVRRGDRVAVILPRSIDLAAALHAVIRLGAAYVPIDPNYPTERVGHIITDATPTTVVTDSAGFATHRTTVSNSVVVIDDPKTRAALDSTTTASIPSPPAPGDTAYVIFTSGTTGRPKGVMVSHAAIVNL
ncbi:hypothetical protein CH251_16495, partial [Rhodococcus sp. 06-462-5]